MTANSSTEPRPPPISLSQLATGLLLLMLLVYALARSWEQAHPALGFVRAFAEAAVVGALADWFAVTALFRRPLGLPLRHTAIIPRNKDRIGAALGRFVEQNFLAPELVAARLAQHQLAGPLAHWLARPDNAERIVGHLVNALPPLLRALDNETLRHFVRDAIVARLRRFEAAPLAGQALELLVAEGRHRPLVDAVLRGAVELLREHEAEIRERVRANTAWIWQKLSMDERIADRIIAAAEDMLLEVSADPQHPWRQRLDRGVADFALALRESQQYRAQGEALKQQLLQHPVLHGDRLRQIARLVHIRALGQGRVVRQQLQRHHVQDGAEHAVVLGHADQVEPVLALDVGVGVGQHVQHAAARAHFLHVAFELFQQGVVGATVTTGMALVTRASGPCLSSPAG
jgi:uncharacterized membrane-anchored protein YjiN (DUF445 family)